MVESGSGVSPLSWRTRIQIAIDVANALVIISCLVDDVENNRILFLEKKLDSLHNQKFHIDPFFILIPYAGVSSFLL